MDAVDYILQGLEAELALERELGVREIEIDRSLIAVPKPEPAKPQSARPVPARPEPVAEPVAPRPVGRPVAPRPVARPEPEAKPAVAAGGTYDFVFLHHAALSEEGERMYRGIVAWMGRSPETAPLVWEGRPPVAKAYVVLGGLALRKWIPGVAAAPGQWVRTPGGRDALVTYSPEYILKSYQDGVETPEAKVFKKRMMLSLTGARHRVDGIS